MNTQNLPNDRSSTVEKTVDEARETKDTAVQAGAHLASSAQEEAQSLVSEAGSQMHNVAGEFMGSLQEQAGMQQQKLADGLRSLGSDLKTMADAGDEEQANSMARQWVREAARRASDASNWLDERDPGALVDEVKRFARRRPVAFLGIAVGAGILAGRLTRSLSAGAAETKPSGSNRRPEVAPAPPVKVPPTPDYVLATRQGGISPDYPPAAPTSSQPVVPGQGIDDLAGDPAVSRPGYGAGGAVGGAAGTMAAAGTVLPASSAQGTAGPAASETNTADELGHGVGAGADPDVGWADAAGEPDIDVSDEIDPDFGVTAPAMEPAVDLEDPSLEPESGWPATGAGLDGDPGAPAADHPQRGNGGGGGLA